MFLSLRFIGTDDGIWDDKQNQVNGSKVDVDWQWPLLASRIIMLKMIELISKLGLAMKYLVTIPDDIISGRWCSWWRYWSAEDNNWKSNQGANCDMAKSIRGKFWFIISQLTNSDLGPQVHQGPHFDLQLASSKCHSPTVNDTNSREWQKLITRHDKEFSLFLTDLIWFPVR